MKQPNLSLWIVLIFLSFWACNSKKAVVEGPVKINPEVVEIEERVLEEVEIKEPKTLSIEETQAKYPSKPYRGSADRHFDLLHTKLDLKFNWEKQRVLGKATLDLTPYYYSTSTLVLDAKNFDINSITLTGRTAPLEFEYDSLQLNIDLGKEYKRGEKFTVIIDYVAKPNEGEVGGSAAISMDKGLYFINPNNTDPNKPQQIWTQGETESSSRWFPTIDKPNERCTQEIYVTVEDRFTTLSNGVMASSKKNADGTRTDYWKMETPHAPYLFMLAIGEYAVVMDKWKGMDVGYYVEKDYEPYARNIFAHTPEMLTFFSDMTGIKYPWSKYSQVVVRDYVSGAMENTTASIFGEFVQKTDRQLIDNSNDAIVAHELFHHWFGDYVTCEGWSNLTINEGFATYGEYLWKEYKYGRDEAEFHRLNSQRAYFMSTKNQGTRPIIDHYYDSREDMFDAHSYNKGGLVLHMLREELGDDAFFEGMNVFLKSKALNSAEIDDLRLVYEEVTGRDLGLFFDQWFKAAGHPILNISTSFDTINSQVKIVVEQMQDPEKNLAVFQIPLTVTIQTKTMTEPIVEEIFLDQRKQEFTIMSPSNYHFIRIDTSNTLLAEINRDLSTAELVYQYENYRDFKDRYSAVSGLSGNYSPWAQNLFVDALDDEFWGIRSKALSEVSIAGNAILIEKTIKMANNDPNSIVRSQAIKLLGDLEDLEYMDLFQSKALDSTEAYNVINASISAIQKLQQTTAEKIAELYIDSKDPGLMSTIGSIYAQSTNKEYLKFFEDNRYTVDPFASFGFYNSYQTLLLKTGNHFDKLETVQKLKEFITDKEANTFRKMAALRMVHGIWKDAKEKAEQENALPDNVDQFGKLDQIVDYIVRNVGEGRAQAMAKSMFNK